MGCGARAVHPGGAHRGPLPLRHRWVFDLALFFLVFSTLGAWGLPISQALGVGTEPLKAALTHLFLDTFGEGWFVLGVLGLAYAAAAETGRPAPRWPVLVAAAGIPFTFALALPAGFVPPLWTWLASFGGVAVAVGLLAAVVLLWRRLTGHRAGWFWHIVLTLLAMKAMGQFVVAVVPGIDWAGLHGRRSEILASVQPGGKTIERHKLLQNHVYHRVFSW